MTVLLLYYNIKSQYMKNLNDLDLDLHDVLLTKSADIMATLTFVVEKTPEGYSAYAEDFDNFPVGAAGEHISELKQKVMQALNVYQEEKKGSAFTEDQVIIQYDLPQFFEFYKEINAKALADRIGMNQSLLSQYVNGQKKPSEKQVFKIISGVKELGKELVELELV